MRECVLNPVILMTLPQLRKESIPNCILIVQQLLYTGEARIRVLTDECDQRVDTSLLEDQVYLAQKCYLDIKICGIERSVVNLS